MEFQFRDRVELACTIPTYEAGTLATIEGFYRRPEEEVLIRLPDGLLCLVPPDWLRKRDK